MLCRQEVPSDDLTACVEVGRGPESGVRQEGDGERGDASRQGPYHGRYRVAASAAHAEDSAVAEDPVGLAEVVAGQGAKIHHAGPLSPTERGSGARLVLG